MDKPQNINAVILVAHDQVAIVLQPGESSRYLPAPLLPPQRSSVLRLPLTASAESITVDESLLISTRVTGDNIGFIFSFLGYFNPDDNSILIADEDFLIGDDTREINGVFYPDWGDTGEVPIDYEWAPVVFGINDGTTVEFALFQPDDYGAADEDVTYAVEGTYTFASGASRYAILYFTAGELESVYGFTNPDGSGAPREITPNPGDTFTILDQYLLLQEDSDEVELVSADGATVTFGEENFTLEELPAPPGEYVVGIIAEDLDGNPYEEYIDVTVTE